MAIVITGMHRSGTSMVVRILNICGLNLGDETKLLAPAADNPAGFWEHRGFVSANEALLAQNGYGWDHLPGRTESLSGAGDGNDRLWDYVNELLRGMEAPWGAKDPRFVWTSDCWPKLFKFVVCLRHPLEVARSLQRRNGMSLAHGLHLWARYNDRAEYMLEEYGEAAIWTHYGAFFERPVQEIRRLCEFAGLSPSGDQVKQAVATISPALWRNRCTLEDLDSPLVKARGMYYLELCKRCEYEPKNIRGMYPSLIVVTLNGLEHTRHCLASIEGCTDVQYELVVVDNGSMDGTMDFIKGYAQARPHVKIVHNSKNIGFAAAVNEGLSIARGDVIVLLNNDTVVTPGWMSRLLDVFQREPRTGIVGAMSNNVSGPQRVPDAPYDDQRSLNEFAANWAAAHAGQSTRTGRITGLCMAIARDVVQIIGGFDPRFFPGNFEDDDYCLRAQAYGFECRIARDAFIHHVGHATFESEGTFASSMADNWERFKEKWKLPADNPMGQYRVDFAEFKGANHHIPLPNLQGSVEHLELTFDDPIDLAKWPSIALCMIVRDEAANLAKCIASYEGIFSRIVVVDTGSTDGTVEIAESIADEVRRFEWCDDFAAARNESIRDVDTEWIFWTDADDRATPDTVRQIKQAAACGKADGYIFKIVSDMPGQSDSSQVVTNHLRLFRNGKGVQFRGRLHEDATVSAKENGLVVAHTNIEIHHTGYASPERQRRKSARNRDILLRMLAQKPDSPELHYHLGICLYNLGDMQGAILHLERALDDYKQLRSNSEVFHAHEIAVVAYTQVGRIEDAERIMQQAYGVWPKEAHLLALMGRFYIQAGRFEEARKYLEKALDVPGDGKFRRVSRDFIKLWLEKANELLPVGA